MCDHSIDTCVTKLGKWLHMLSQFVTPMRYNDVKNTLIIENFTALALMVFYISVNDTESRHLHMLGVQAWNKSASAYVGGEKFYDDPEFCQTFCSFNL